VDYIGTPYAEDDAYAHLLQYRKPEVILIRPAWEIKPSSKHKREDELGESDYSLLFPFDGKGEPQLTYKALLSEKNEDERLFNSQYLCDAKPTKDAVVFTDFIIDAHTISSEGLPQAGTYKTVSVWDCASSDNKGSDYSVGGVGFFCIAGPLVGRMFIVDIVRGKFSRYELPHQIAKQAGRRDFAGARQSDFFDRSAGLARVPRIESGEPEHPATKSSAVTAIPAVTILLLRLIGVIHLLFRLALALHLLKLLTLIFDFLLLRVNLGLGLSICVFVVLHLVTNHVSANASDTRADGRARKRSTYCRTDDRASCSTETCADESTLLSRREWLS